MQTAEPETLGPRRHQQCPGEEGIIYRSLAKFTKRNLINQMRNENRQILQIIQKFKG